MAAAGYIELFAGKDTAESRAAAFRLSLAIEAYLSRCEAENARKKRGA